MLQKTGHITILIYRERDRDREAGTVAAKMRELGYILQQHRVGRQCPQTYDN